MSHRKFACPAVKSSPDASTRDKPGDWVWDTLFPAYIGIKEFNAWLRVDSLGGSRAKCWWAASEIQHDPYNADFRDGYSTVGLAT